MEYKGYLVSVDGYMNMQLANTEEYIDGALSEHLGEVLIRCNNVLYIRGVEEDGEMREKSSDYHPAARNPPRERLTISSWACRLLQAAAISGDQGAADSALLRKVK
ncbi:Small nuclear ribonucleoprotein F [Platysternon megacephalum]|uniref:Sm protein F n=1 Tax=Platysternon megacephalum TaxID=55544 RepID=A0A4D9F6E3_9SAUR|nr:Small nuclear ribonucleoprotein F [Platysternon megacephalum]